MNRSRLRDPRFWRRWALSGAMNYDTPCGLRVLAECATAWASRDPSTARPGDSWPVYAAAAPVDFDARCRTLAMQHGATLPGVCRACGGKFGGCIACFLSGRAAGTPEWSTARERIRARFGDDVVAMWAARTKAGLPE